MTGESFTALVVEEAADGLRSGLRQVTDSDLRAHAPPGADVTVRVRYSTLNYKDGLAMHGLGKIVRHYPHVPGVDLAGTVLESDSPDWKPGDRVIVSGFRMGELYWGGFAQAAHVRADWLVPLPAGLDLRRAMAIGTAGLTAMLAVMALEAQGLRPDSGGEDADAGAGAGEVLVTGAAGGVGSIAVALLASLGYRVAAATGREETHDYLKGLGAHTIVARAELATPPAKPLAPERWAGAVDAVGGTTLATILATLKAGASVAATGLVGGVELHSTVLPFLLRGINLLGIDSTDCPMARRHQAWQRLAHDLPADLIDAVTTVVPLAEVPALSQRILKGRVRGRVVIDLDAPGSAHEDARDGPRDDS